MNGSYEVVVAGAGMVGLTAACLLAAEDRLNLTVIDAAGRPSFDPQGDVSLRVSAIAPGSQQLLARLGAWEEIRNTRMCPYRAMKVWDATGHVDSPETLVFDAAGFALPALGHIVENALLQHALLVQLEEQRVNVRFATPIRSVVRHGHRFELELDDGERLRPDLLVGADGAMSVVRGSAGIAVRTWPYAQRAFVAHLQPERGHRNTAWQRFLQEGPVGLLPLADGRVSVVWSTTPDIADEALRMSDETLSDKLTAVTDGVLGRLSAHGARGTFPLEARHAAQYVQEGLVLIGDAAHSIHPLAGQGVNLGFADAEELAHVLGRALDADENPGDLPTLRRYERARKGANEAMLRFTDALNRLFSNDSPSLARLRRAGMFLFNKSGPVRDRAVRTALGIR